MKPFKTTKFHIEDYLFLPLIKLFWEPFSGKRSHWWNWSNTKNTFSKSVHIEGEKSLHPLNNLWNVLVELNFRWNKLVILQPVNYRGEYQLAYSNSKYKEICSIVLEDQVACLINHEDTKYSGFSYPKGKEIQLRIVGYTYKKKLQKDILFL